MDAGHHEEEEPDEYEEPFRGERTPEKDGALSCLTARSKDQSDEL